MATYILLMTLTPAGREAMLANPETIRHVEASLDVPETQVLGLYAVLGEYDFIGILEASDNETAARFALALGVRANVRTVTLPAIPIGRLEGAGPIDPARPAADRAPEPAGDAGE